MKPLICFLTLLTISNPIQAIDEIKSEYPRFRHYRAGFNVAFGAMTYFKAKSIIKDPTSTNYEKQLASGLTAIGILRFSDGLYFFFKSSLPEQLLADGKLDPDSPDQIASLKKAAQFERKLKFYRGGVIMLNGIGFLSVYAADPEKNTLALYPGLGMAIVSIYAMLKKAPAEKALNRLVPKNTWGINYKRSQSNDFTPYPEYSYRF